MSLRSILVLGSTLAIIGAVAIAGTAEAQCWLCTADGFICTPAANQHSGYKICSEQTGHCVLSGDFCGLTVLEDVDADGTRSPLPATTPVAAEKATDVEPGTGIVRGLDCKGLIVGRVIAGAVLDQFDHQLDTISL